MIINRLHLEYGIKLVLPSSVFCNSVWTPETNFIVFRGRSSVAVWQLVLSFELLFWILSLNAVGTISQTHIYHMRPVDFRNRSDINSWASALTAQELIAFGGASTSIPALLGSIVVRSGL